MYCLPYVCGIDHQMQPIRCSPSPETIIDATFVPGIVAGSIRYNLYNKFGLLSHSTVCQLHEVVLLMESTREI